MSKAIAWQKAYDALQLAKTAEQKAYAELMEELASMRPTSHMHLSGRQIEVLQGICENMQNKQIGNRLNISCRTVKFHVSALLQKFSADDRYHLRRIVDESPEVFGSIGIVVTSDTTRIRAIA